MPAASVSDDPEVRAASVRPDITRVDTRCLDQLYGFPGNGSSGWPGLESLFLGVSVCLRATAARSTAVWIFEAAWSAALDHPASCRLSTFPLHFSAPNNHDGNVPGCRLKATHELERGGWLYLEASMEFHREKHLVPFL